MVLTHAASPRSTQTQAAQSGPGHRAAAEALRGVGFGTSVWTKHSKVLCLAFAAVTEAGPDRCPWAAVLGTALRHSLQHLWPLPAQAESSALHDRQTFRASLRVSGKEEERNYSPAPLKTAGFRGP